MLVVVIAATRWIIGERFIICLIARAGLVPRVGADGVKDADDDPNGAGPVTVAGVSGHT